MIYSVDFNELTEKINPLAFSKYLIETGWKKIDSKRSYVSIFKYVLHQDQDFVQVTLPMDKGLGDYKWAMYKAIETVAELEKKSVEQVFLYLLNPRTDILKIRLNKPEIEVGNISLDDAINMYNNAKRLLGATAQDIVKPNKYHRGRVDDSVQEFLSNCRFGQTEIGSYVVSVICPFAELDSRGEYEQLSIFSDEERCADSLTRKVTNRVMKNIATIKEGIDSGNIKRLVEMQDGLISANFYEALNGLNLEADLTNVEFNMIWSPTVPVRDGIQSKILLNHDYYAPIKETIQRIRAEQNQSVRIVGLIKSLTATPYLEERTFGKITVVSIAEGLRKKTYTASLLKDDYERAVEAHQRGSYVILIGEIIGDKRSEIQYETFDVIE